MENADNLTELSDYKTKINLGKEKKKKKLC